MFNSLRRKMIATIICITLFCTLVFMAISYYEVRRATIQQMENDGSTLISTVRRDIKEYKLSDIDLIRDIFTKVASESNGNITYVSIADKNRNIKISSDKTTEKNLSANASEVDAVAAATVVGDISNVINEEKTKGFIFETAQGQKVYNVSTPFYEGSKLVGTINIGISLESMYKVITRGAVETIIASLLLLIVAVIAGMIISTNMTKYKYLS